MLRRKTALLSWSQQSCNTLWLDRAAWHSSKEIVIICYRWWSLVQKQGTTALPKTADGVVLPLWEAVSHRVFPSGTHWLTSKLGSCLCMELSVSIELGIIFIIQPLHLLLVAVGCFLCETRIFMSSPMNLVSLHVAQICTDFLSLKR